MNWCYIISNVSSQSHFKKQLNDFILSSYIQMQRFFWKLGCFPKLYKRSLLNWYIQLNSVLYYFSSQHYLTWPNNKSVIITLITLPLLCPWLFHSASFTILFYIYIINCTYHMLGSVENRLGYTGLQSPLIIWCSITASIQRQPQLPMEHTTHAAIKGAKHYSSASPSRRVRFSFLRISEPELPRQHCSSWSFEPSTMSPTL